MEQITLGKFSQIELDHLLHESTAIADISGRIDFLSGQFLAVPYRESTLIGDRSRAEVFVINFAGVDCFTLLDYVEALRVSKSFSAFKENLAKVRYRSGEIAFEKRNHFFTDWKEFNAALMDDVTEAIAEGNTRKITKNLNEREDTSHFLPGVPCREREIVYIPSSVIDEKISAKLQTGDYIGIYSDRMGLDVSHVGIFVRKKGTDCIRHASSTQGKVVDEDFQKYILDKPGILVLRPGGF